jgi:hypothetical protein
MYLIFGGDDYYPEGGWKDYKGSSKTLEQAKIIAATLKNVDWWHIVKDGKIILRNKKPKNYGFISE